MAGHESTGRGQARAERPAVVLVAFGGGQQDFETPLLVSGQGVIELARGRFLPQLSSPGSPLSVQTQCSPCPSDSSAGDAEHQTHQPWLI
jgi:hypothetical protein